MLINLPSLVRVNQLAISRENYIMNDSSDIKKITATLTGEEAIELELLGKSLHIDKLAKSKSERDKLFFNLALTALQKTVKNYAKANNLKYPSYEQIKDYLHKSD